MNFDFVEVETNKIADLLPMVKEAMPELRKRPGLTWQAEHVYGALFLGLSQLSIVLKDYEPAGFIVHRWMIEAQTNQRYLHIWLFYLFKNQRGILKEVTTPALNYLSEKCKQGGGTFVEMQSTRQGWERCLTDHMELTYLNFRKRV